MPVEARELHNYRRVASVLEACDSIDDCRNLTNRQLQAPITHFEGAFTSKDTGFHRLTERGIKDRSEGVRRFRRPPKTTDAAQPIDGSLVFGTNRGGPQFCNGFE